MGEGFTWAFSFCHRGILWVCPGTKRGRPEPSDGGSDSTQPATTKLVNVRSPIWSWLGPIPSGVKSGRGLRALQRMAISQRARQRIRGWTVSFPFF